MEVTWAARKCDIRWRSLVCSRINRGVKPDTRYSDKIVNGILSLDR